MSLGDIWLVMIGLALALVALAALALWLAHAYQ
jgi:hypothetical protein